MAKNKKQSKKGTNGGRQPDIKAKHGIWQLAGWIEKKTIPAKSDYEIEREVTIISMCLTGAVRRNGDWDNIKIWFRSSQFENLQQVIEEAGEQLREKLNELNKVSELEFEGGEE
jgi:hypothetical protein